MDLGRVGQNQADFRRDSGSNINGARQRGPKQLEHLFGDRNDVDEFVIGIALAAEGQNLFHQITGPVPGLEHLCHVVARLRVLRQIVVGYFGVADNRPQDIVEIMGDTTGQRANGLHFLGLEKLILHAAALTQFLLQTRVEGGVVDGDGGQFGELLKDALLLDIKLHPGLAMGKTDHPADLPARAQGCRENTADIIRNRFFQSMRPGAVVFDAEGRALAIDPADQALIRQILIADGIGKHPQTRLQNQNLEFLVVDVDKSGRSAQQQPGTLHQCL